MKIIPLALVLMTLIGCGAAGPPYNPVAARASAMATILVYRVSQIGGSAGTWVPSRLEVNDLPARRLAADSFVTLTVPAGEISLSVTDMVNLHYADKDRMTLRENLSGGETAFFRLISVFGRGCEAIHEKANGPIASATHRPGSDWDQTTCFQRVPESLALKSLHGLRSAD